jgi:inner membrane protein
MDNLSHSVVGLAVGELVQRSFAPEPDPLDQHLRRRLLVAACWAASNFPDLDIVLTRLLPRPLGYLLHHRGHTHTLLYAVPQALLLMALIWLLWPAARRLLAQSSSARRGMVLAVGLGFILHLAMDFLNSYGLHPFHPFDSRWFYGDMVFILEPLFWIAAGVPLAMMVKRRAIRMTLLGMLSGTLAWGAHAGFLHWSSIVLLGLVGMAVGAVQPSAAIAGRDARRPLAAGLAACLAFIAIQSAGSSHGKHELAAELRQRDPGAELVDISMTAYPANPMCWNFITIERNEPAGAYRLRRGVLSLAPGLFPVEQCPAGLSGSVPRQHSSSGIAIFSNNQGSLAALRRLEQENCYFRAWLRFARTPLVTGNSASDIRFSTSLATNFSTIDLAHFVGRACPANVPNWAFPRADLLRPH